MNDDEEPPALHASNKNAIQIVAIHVLTKHIEVDQIGFFLLTKHIFTNAIPRMKH